MMKTLRFSLITLGLALIVGCSNTRITTASEYDSVYFTSKDKVGATYAQNDDDDRNQRNFSDERDDDFQYSRRLRRFNTNVAVSNWRYYDPYFSNDLYYVMGTPYWSTWNNNGWYNCNSPYLGSPYGYAGYNNIYANWGGGFYSPYYSMGCYNPWVNNYYGYNPYNIGGYYGYNPYGGYACYYGAGHNWNNYNYYNHAGYNTPKNVWHHGSTNSFVGATAATNGGTVRPTPTMIQHGIKNTALPQNGTNAPINGNIGETSAPIKYLKPRSNQDFNNQPPKTYTNNEMYNGGAVKNSGMGGSVKNNGTGSSVKNPTIPNYNNNGGAVKGGNTPIRNNTPTTAPIRNNPPIRNNTPTTAPIKNNPPAVRPQSSPSFNNNNSGGGFSRPSGGGSSSGGSSSGGGRRK